MKILLLDIETAPNLGYVWGLWNQNIGTNQIVNSGYVMCWAARWYGEKTVHFFSIMESSEKVMLKKLHDLLGEADVVVHYNGSSFDIPTINKEFLILGMNPPSPYIQIDLLKVVRDKFRFPSNKLDYVSQTLKIGQKIRHEGFELWVRCMAKEPAAWVMMKKYNIHDVKLLGDLYDRLLPWIDKHPNKSVGVGLVCPNCGSVHSKKQGLKTLTTGVYQQYQCLDCGKWYRSSQPIQKLRGERSVGIS